MNCLNDPSKCLGTIVSELCQERLASGEMRAARVSRPFCAERCMATASCLADFPTPQIIFSGRALSSQLVLGSASVCKISYCCHAVTMKHYFSNMSKGNEAETGVKVVSTQMSSYISIAYRGKASLTEQRHCTTS